MALRHLAMRSYQQRELVSPCIFQMGISTGRERPALPRDQSFLSSTIRGGRHMESTYKGVDSKSKRCGPGTARQEHRIDREAWHPGRTGSSARRDRTGSSLPPSSLPLMGIMGGWVGRGAAVRVMALSLSPAIGTVVVVIIIISSIIEYEHH